MIRIVFRYAKQKAKREIDFDSRRQAEYWLSNLPQDTVVHQWCYLKGLAQRPGQTKVTR